MLEKVRIQKIITPTEIAEVQILNESIWGVRLFPHINC